MNITLTYPTARIDEDTKRHTEQFVEQLDELKAAAWRIDAYSKKIEEIASIIQEGICLEAKSGENTMLHMASDGDHQRVVEMLIAAGANKEALESEGLTPLQVVARGGQEGSCEALLKYGANIEAKGRSSLMLALIHDKSLIADWLLEKGANIYRAIAFGNGTVETALDRFPYCKKRIEDWKQQYDDYADRHIAPQTPEDVYHLLAVYPLKDFAQVDRDSELRQIFSHSDWKDPKQVKEIIAKLIEDKTIDVEFGETLRGIAQGKLQLVRGRAK